VLAEGVCFECPLRAADRITAGLGRIERLVRAAIGLARTSTRVTRQDLRTWLRPDPPSLPPPSRRSFGAPIVFLPAIPWNYRFQRPQQLACALARLGHPILYLDAFARHWIQPELQLETHYGGAVSVLRVAVLDRPDLYRETLSTCSTIALSRKLCRGLQTTPLAIVVQLPGWAPLALALHRALRLPLVYDCLDLHIGFPRVPEEMEGAEGHLIAAADVVTVSSLALWEHASRWSDRLLLLPNAVSPGAFSAPTSPPTGETVVGYVGALASWFDHDLVRQLAVARPAWRFRLAGRVETTAIQKLGKLANVELLGEIPHRLVAGFLAGLHVLLVPFHDCPLTRAADPVKVYEALATGLPVVSRSLPQLARWDPRHVHLFEAGDDVVAKIERAIADNGRSEIAARKALVSSETWDARARDLLAGLSAHERGGAA
jgi:glycosyltransferase involved in cell wall biosynthesis